MALLYIRNSDLWVDFASRHVKVSIDISCKRGKGLITGVESNDDVEIKNAIKDIVSTCTFGQIDASKLRLFDLEYVFLQVRSKSVGEVTSIDYFVWW